MNTQDIINKIAKLKDAIEGETDPDVKSRFASKIASLEAELNKAEEKVEVKIEKQQVAEQKDLTEAEKKIAKLKDALSGETDPDVKARFEKKIKELQGDLGEVKQEIKEEKKEIAKQKKEIKQAVKEVRSVKKVVRKEGGATKEPTSFKQTTS
jgi:TATA-binding protein-associated factor Taf7